MREAVIVASSRTPLAKSFRGSFNLTRPDDLAAHCIADVLRKVPQVDRAVVKERAAKLRAKGTQSLSRFLGAQTGSEVEVLIEQDGIGRTRQFAEIQLAGDAPPGAMVRARVHAQVNQARSGGKSQQATRSSGGLDIERRRAGVRAIATKAHRQIRQPNLHVVGDLFYGSQLGLKLFGRAHKCLYGSSVNTRWQQVCRYVGGF